MKVSSLLIAVVIVVISTRNWLEQQGVFSGLLSSLLIATAITSTVLATKDALRWAVMGQSIRVWLPDKSVLLFGLLLLVESVILDQSPVWQGALPRQALVLLVFVMLASRLDWITVWRLQTLVLTVLSATLSLSALLQFIGSAPVSSGIFNHPNTAALIASLAVAGLAQLQGNLARAIVAMSSLYVGLGSGSETYLLFLAVLGLPVALSVIAPERSETRAIVLVGGAVVFLSTLVPLMIAALPSIREYFLLSITQPSIFARFAVWESSFSAFGNSVLFGHGSESIFANYIAGYSMHEQLLYAHNLWLTYLALGGLVLTLPVAAVTIYSVLDFNRRTNSQQLVLMATLLFSSVEYTLQLDTASWIVFLLFAHVVSDRDPSKKHFRLMVPPPISR